MALQHQVGTKQPLGVIGGFFDSSVRRVAAYTLDGTGRAGCVAVFVGADKVSTTGADSSRYAGVLCNPAGQAVNGLEATLDYRDGAPVEAATMGRIVVQVASVAAQGDRVVYAVATGLIAPLAPGTAVPAGHKEIPGASFYIGGAAGELAVITL